MVVAGPLQNWRMDYDNSVLTKQPRPVKRACIQNESPFRGFRCAGGVASTVGAATRTHERGIRAGRIRPPQPSVVFGCRPRRLAALDAPTLYHVPRRVST